VGIGGSIFLIALGAIFAFAVEVDLGFLDLNVVGWVLMLAGVVGLILTMWFWNSRRRPAVAPTTHDTVEEYREVRREPPL
jgi:protein-S-isoprenylcysteine O-methyltransferase Ste14